MDVARLLAEKKHATVESVRPDTSIQETAQKLVDRRIGALVVVDGDGKMVGIVSERDLVPLVAGTSGLDACAPVGEVMTRAVITCSPEDEVGYILHLMNAKKIRHMPVTRGGALVGMLSIRELTQAYELMRIEANTDPLTQVSNRRPFLKLLEQEFERADRFGHNLSIAMLDIDHFKSVNDTHGHDVGDAALRALAALLIGEFRTIDLVGRLGGEEFALLFPETDLPGAAAACERLMSSIRRADIAAGSTRLKLTVSMGLALGPAGKNDGAEVLRAADRLLYRAKAEGRDRLIVETSATAPPPQTACSDSQVAPRNA